MSPGNKMITQNTIYEGNSNENNQENIKTKR